jgi:hypothetical protein
MNDPEQRKLYYVRTPHGMRWEGEPKPGQARSLIIHNCDPDTYKQTLKAIAEQGMFTTNRATRRKSQRVGDKARRKKAREQ